MHAEMISGILIGLGVCLLVWVVVRLFQTFGQRNGKPAQFPRPSIESQKNQPVAQSNTTAKAFHFGPVDVTSKVTTNRIDIPAEASSLMTQGKLDEAAAVISRELAMEPAQARELVNTIAEFRNKGVHEGRQSRTVTATVKQVTTFPGGVTTTITTGDGKSCRISGKVMDMIESGNLDQAVKLITEESGIDAATVRSMIEDGVIH